PALASHVQTLLPGTDITVAATDYVRAYAGLIAPYLTCRYVVLGTDGFGRSDTRTRLREFFEIDRTSIVIATLHALAEEGRLPPGTVADAIARYGINPAT